MLSCPSLNTGSCKDTGSCIASKQREISSSPTLNSFDISVIDGSFPYSFVYFSLYCMALYAKSRIDLLTLILLLSLKYLFISPNYHWHRICGKLYSLCNIKIIYGFY